MQIRNRSYRRKGLALSTAITLLSAAQAFTVELLVYNNNDSGAGSLRQAIIDNNTLGGLNIIVFSNVVSGTITLTNGELLIKKYVTIVGPGPGNLAVNGNAAGRVFHFSGPLNAFVSGLTITNGAVSGSFPGNVGGGIWNDHSTLTLSNCVVSGNNGGGGPGGGIYNDGSSSAAALWIIASTVSGNSCTNHGGGIWNYGYEGNASISVIASTVKSNTASGATSVGGGIFNDGNYGIATLAMSASTFTGNSAGQYGGGIYNSGAGSGYGGLSVFASTFSDNAAAFGGGIFHNGVGGTATLTIGNTILKTGTSGANIINNGGNVGTFGYNLSNDNGGGGLTNATDRLNSDPLLGPLADNGGPTITHALLPGSPAIDKGHSFGLTTDQRGEPRPFDFVSATNAAGGDGSDIGAFEVGRPKLSIQQVGSSAVLSWPSNYVNFTLQSSTNAASSNGWITVAGSPDVVGDQYQQTNDAISSIRFFRLRGN